MTLANLGPRKKRGRLPAAILVTDAARLPDPLRAAGRMRAGGGILLRHYEAADRRDLARRLAALARRRHLSLLVAGPDWRLAAAVGAAGVHLPEALARRWADPGLRLWLRRGHLLTVACHSPAALARAAALGADAALLSPVFATASHPGAAVLGATRFALWAARARVPVLALGGINAATQRALRFAAGFAAIGGLNV